MNAGIYPFLNNKTYHADSAISRSGIMKFIESPYKYWAAYLNPHRPPTVTTSQMEFGTAFHAWLLEPDTFFSNYISEIQLHPSPERVLLKNVGAAVYESYKAQKIKVDAVNDQLKDVWAEQAKGKKVLKLEELAQILAMQEAIFKNKESNLLLKHSFLTEQSYFWQDNESGLMIKARPDILHDNIIIDLKTCLHADSKNYFFEMQKYGYHVQGAMIREGIRVLTGKDIPNVVNICVEKTYPYAIGIKIISEERLNEGKQIFKAALMKMKSAFDNNYFPDYEPETV